jgi:uncharacterized protein YndB with AHSA1/START domain
MIKETLISELPEGRKLLVERSFAAPLATVWKAWTQSELLDLWWAPKPWKAETKHIDFSEGGHWLYAMKGPEGEVHWAREDFHRIEAERYFTATDSFCDESGTINAELPSMDWKNEFLEEEGGTRVRIEITLASEAALLTIVEMGFREGFTMAHRNLDKLLEDLSKKI